MKMIFTPSVDELARNPDKLRDMLINITMLNGMYIIDLARECNVSYACMRAFFKKNRMPNIVSRRKMAAVVEKMDKEL